MDILTQVAERIDVEWPLIGRDGDLAVIAAALHGGAGIVLSGPAGVGKSRLAREALAGHDGARWVRASGSARSVPLRWWGSTTPTSSTTYRPRCCIRRRSRGRPGWS